MKYIDANILRKEIERVKEYWIQYRKDKTTISEWSAGYNEGMASSYDNFLSLIDTIQQEQTNDLASLISEATNVAKRIIDRDSFYNSLPQNIRNKYTSKAWYEILEALSTMKIQEQPEVDLEKEIEEYFPESAFNTRWNYDDMQGVARHFFNLGLNARKGENK